jgi:hypothetical protein
MRRFLLLPLLFIASIALAHDVVKGPNGGLVRHGGMYHLELVTKNTDLTVYLTDKDDKPVDAVPSSVRATVLTGGSTHTVTLTPDFSMVHKLEGTLPKPLEPGAKVIVSLPQAAPKPPIQVRFEIK